MEQVNAAERILAGVVDKIRASASVEMAYGPSRVIGDKTIIPIAVVSYGFGAGAGGGQAEATAESPKGGTGGGGGGGGGVKVKPIAVLEVSAEGTRLIPVFDLTRLLTLGVVALVLWAWLSRGRGK